MTQVVTQRRPTRSSKMVSSSAAMRIKRALRKKLVREFLSEFLSTYVMMVFGLGSVAHMVLGSNKFGTFLGVNLGFGFGVTMGVYMGGDVSGAHMNAAVTFTSCALGRMSWKRFPVYVLGQFLGSFMAAVTIYVLFYSIIHFSGGQLTVTGPRATAGIFATYLPAYMTLWRGFVDEVVVTAILQLCLFAIGEKKSPEMHGTQPVVIGFLVTVIGISLGMNSGYGINPSRDLPPRFFTYIAGWGQEVFRANENWWWVPVVAPILGAYVGGLVYLVFIGSNTPRAPQGSEDPAAFEDHRTSALPKTTHDSYMASSFAAVSEASTNRASGASPFGPASVTATNRPSVPSSLSPASVAPTNRVLVPTPHPSGSVAPTNRASVHPALSTHDSGHIEHF
ncbi:aquaporin-7 isoform X2 [Nycticebus coucang]|uniref:aquaporin-7 isoform X2 n=1 Tax=Nycticebus coucang TaxID=9470 RepID=UPI00234C47E3|nr:aquaporin-7 isoform X2 [Nycticebus coucang]